MPSIYKDECVHCGAPFVKFRKDKQFCSNVCQMRAYRSAQKEKLDILERLISKLPSRNRPHIINDLFA